MRVSFDFQYWDEDAYARAHSDLYCLDIDCISLLLNPVSSIKYAKKLQEELDHSKVEWWFDCSRVEGSGDNLRIYTDISYNDEHALIDRETLKKVVRDWIHFLETREPAEYEY